MPSPGESVSVTLPFVSVTGKPSASKASPSTSCRTMPGRSRASVAVTPTGKPPPLAVRLAKALPFRRASIEMRDSLIAHDDLHTADSAHACARLGIYSDHMARQGRRYGTYAMAAGMLQGLQALSARQWPPLGAFIKLPALRVVHDLLPFHHYAQPHHQMEKRTTLSLLGA